MAKHHKVIPLLCCLSGLALSVPTSQPTGAYPYGTTTCLQGNDGNGLRLYLRHKLGCEGKVTCPYLEVDVTDIPVPVQKRISIGTDNRAFRCHDARESCEQAVEGDVIFDHFEDISGKTIQTDGYYELKFSNGRSESGIFKVTCFAPCG